MEIKNASATTDGRSLTYIKSSILRGVSLFQLHYYFIAGVKNWASDGLKTPISRTALSEHFHTICVSISLQHTQRIALCNCMRPLAKSEWAFSINLYGSYMADCYRDCGIDKRARMLNFMQVNRKCHLLPIFPEDLKVLYVGFWLY